MIETEAANSSNRAFQLGDAGGTIEVVESTQTLTLFRHRQQRRTTSGALTKTGAGSARPFRPHHNTYTGGTTVSLTTPAPCWSLNYSNNNLTGFR
jgi:hypothetical protein